MTPNPASRDWFAQAPRATLFTFQGSWEIMIRAHRIAVLFCATLTLLTAMAVSVSAAVLPASATPLGYSLANLAQATAVYNTGIQANNPATPAPPNIPFQVVVNNTTVGLNTYLYLPIFVGDDSAPVDPAFPASITNQATDAAYLDNVVKTGFNVSAFLVQVDGQTTVLDDSYITGVSTPTLLDGTPGGTHYIVSAAVIEPLGLGDHTVSFGGLINGQPQIFGSSVVTVVPEPAAMGALAIGSLMLVRSRRRRI
jgi:hypothetical protein